MNGTGLKIWLRVWDKDKDYINGTLTFYKIFLLPSAYNSTKFILRNLTIFFHFFLCELAESLTYVSEPMRVHHVIASVLKQTVAHICILYLQGECLDKNQFFGSHHNRL